jgi:hypothetical protein
MHEWELDDSDESWTFLDHMVSLGRLETMGGCALDATSREVLGEEVEDDLGALHAVNR